MKLSEIYQKGEEVIVDKKWAFGLRGVETEYVLKNNEEIFRKYRFLQKAINSIETTTKTRLLDVELQSPVIMSSISSPIPNICQDALLKVATALKESGSMMWLGSPMPKNLKELVNTGVPIAQTIKPLADRAKLLEVLLEAQSAGVNWVGIEVDAGQGTKVLDQQMTTECSPISAGEIKEIKRKLTRPLILKGILSHWDAKSALEAGADIIMVSNHGGHSIDYLPHPLEVMNQITPIIKNRIPIVVDGGFRRGTDVLKGLAFGAQAIGLGRPIIYALAADGQDGVISLLTEITEELKRVMTMTGIKDPNSAHMGIILT